LRIVPSGTWASTAGVLLYMFPNSHCLHLIAHPAYHKQQRCSFCFVSLVAAGLCCACSVGQFSYCESLYRWEENGMEWEGLVTMHNSNNK